MVNFDLQNRVPEKRFHINETLLTNGYNYRTKLMFDTVATLYVRKCKPLCQQLLKPF